MSLPPQEEKKISVIGQALMQKSLRLVTISMTEGSHRASVYEGTRRLFQCFAPQREQATQLAMDWIEYNYAVIKEM